MRKAALPIQRRARRRPAAHPRQGHAPRRRVGALRRDRREPRVGADRSCRSWSRSSAAPRARSRTSPRRSSRPHEAPTVTRRSSGDSGGRGQGRDGRVGQARALLHARPRRRHPRLRDPRRGSVGAPPRPARTPPRCSSRPTGSSRSSGRPRPTRPSSCRSRSRRSTGTACSPTSPGCCPTSGSASCRRTSPPTATASRSASSPSRWPRPSTWRNLLRAIRNVEGVYDAYRVHAAH